MLLCIGLSISKFHLFRISLALSLSLTSTLFVVHAYLAKISATHYFLVSWRKSAVLSKSKYCFITVFTTFLFSWIQCIQLKNESALWHERYRTHSALHCGHIFFNLYIRPLSSFTYLPLLSWMAFMQDESCTRLNFDKFLLH